MKNNDQSGCFSEIVWGIGIVLLLWILYYEGCFNDKVYPPPRERVGVDTLYTNDSVYVISSKLDTVYYEPQEHEVESNRP